MTKCAAEIDWSWNLPYFNTSQRCINDYYLYFCNMVAMYLVIRHSNDIFIMKYKARLIGKRYIKNGYAKELFYEYRGKEYMLTVYNNGYMQEPLYKQHAEEQLKIDKIIENENKPIKQGTFDIDEIFNVLGWEE